MSKKMLINATHAEENRVAIVEDGILTELDIEVVGREQTRGNIYKATVVRVEPGLQAAFVDYGGTRLGFLQMGEIHPAFFKAADPQGERKGKLRINDILRRGQELIVQIVKGERGTKGAALTTFLSLAGRYMVLMPESDSKGLSRKIEAEGERKKIKEAMNSLNLPENLGYIVRTAGIGQSKEELKRDFDYLVRVYENILALGKKAKAPALIYKESNLVIRSIRDYFTSDIDEVLVDDPKVAQEAKDFFQQVMPECVKLVKLHQEKRPIFSRYQLEEQIDIVARNKVPLPSGGSIVIDRTEALVSIDVNSGKLSGEQGIEATALRTNLEAAEEAARQLRLRDLGGLIVIDFIDMRERKNEREVEKRLKDALKKDKARVTVGKISQFGMLEMSRQRIKDALAEGTFLVCPHCEGSGRLKSPEAQAVAFLRKVQASIAKGQIGRVDADVPFDVAIYLLNAKRAELTELEERYSFELVIRGRSDLVAGQVEIATHKREKEDDLYLPPVSAAAVEPPPPVPVAPASAPAEPQPTEEPPAAKKRGRKKKEVEAPVEPVIEAVAEPVPGETVAVAEESATISAAEAARFGSLLAESDEEDETSEGGKKKRKRRRKKKKSAAASDAAEPSASTGDSDEEDSEAAADAGDDNAENEAGDEIAGSGEAGAKKRKRKRRRKKKGAAASDTATAEGQATVTVSAPPAEPVTVASDDSSAEVPTKKKRRRKRKKKGAVTAEVAAVPPMNEAVATPAAIAEAVEVSAVEPPARKPRRKAAAEPVVSSVDETPAVAPELAMTKPKRTRKPAIKAETGAPPAEDAPPAAPPAKRSRAKKPAAEVAVSPAAVEEPVPQPPKRGRKPKTAATE